MELKRKIFIIIGILIFSGILLVSANGTGEKEKDENNSVNVKTEKLQFQPISDVKEFSGIIRGEEEAALSPKITGIVQKMYRQEGDYVKKGEILAYIDGNELLQQRNLAYQNTKGLEENLKETEDYYGQLIDEAESALDKAEEVLDIAERGTDRDAEELAEEDVEAAEEAVRSAKKLEDLQMQLIKSQLNASQEQLGLANIQAGNTRIRAPFSGYITAKNADVGSLVGPNSTIYEIAKSQQKEIKISVPGSVAEKISVGQEVRIEIEDGISAIGSIKSISPLADFISRKASIKIILSETGSENARLGSFANVFIETEKIANAIKIPLSSLVNVYDDNYVFIKKESKAELVKVETGIIEGDFIEIVSGLNEGDLLVTEGQFYLRDGDTI